MTVQALRRGRPEVLAELLNQYTGTCRPSPTSSSATGPPQRTSWPTACSRPSTTVGVSVTTMPCDRRCFWIATNKALRYRQRAAHVVNLQVVEGAIAEPRGPTADDSLALWQAVRGLPPRMRAAVGLRYYLDLPVETVAEVLQVSPNTIKTQLKSALAGTCGLPSPTNPCPSRRCDMP